jgi:hypothetical protein
MAQPEGNAFKRLQRLLATELEQGTTDLAYPEPLDRVGWYLVH